MDFLCKLLLPRNDRKRRRSNSAKPEPIPSLDHLNRLHHFVADPNIHVKAREPSTVHARIDRVATSTLGRSVQLLARLSHKKLKVIVELDRGGVL